MEAISFVSIVTVDTRLAKSPDEYSLKNELGSASTRANVAASVTTSSLVAMRFMTRLRQAPMSAADTAAPSRSAAIGRMSPAWPLGATTPKAIWLAQAGTSPTRVAASAAATTSR